MSEQIVRQHVRIHAPIEQVFDFFADHKRFITLLGARCTVIQPGTPPPYGLGSVRRMGFGPLAFEETTLTYKPHEQLEYAITRGGPMRAHRGTIDFRREDDTTVVDYVIRFEARLPLIGPLIAKALALAWSLNAPRALKKLERAT
ncbi:SRPBCC family protein [Sinimarinibacterium sp. NLF-5-8]|uniref:SRPBCC family protein n=1 Tax=Sinimarinibacterium sp. NLF-5-8 TaxID=2698684 RepID=UPI00137BF809|nr:SRPBCC family protein [Sinimarinibacterium sp. NLF-5-8]QHS10270.1 SRPBCC family protein [Sinimarinibacterium sp. NLF-5-8]